MINEYEINEKYETNIKDKDEVVDLYTHIKILNFLIHLQSIGVINEIQRTEYSKHIQNYLKERKDNLDFFEEFFNLIKNKSF